MAKHVEVYSALPKDIKDLHRIDAGAEALKPWVHADAVRDGRVKIAVVESVSRAYLRRGWYLWDDRIPYIQAVHVEESHRREGLASTLIADFIATHEAAVAEHFYPGVASSVGEFNAGSIALHQALGFEDRGYIPMVDQPDEREILFYRPFATTIN